MQNETEKVMRTDTQKLVEDLRKLAIDLEGGNYGEADKLVASAADKIDDLIEAIFYLVSEQRARKSAFEYAEGKVYEFADKIKLLETENALLKGRKR